MKLLICVLALSCAIVYASDDLPWKPVPQQLTTDLIPPHNQRFPRQAEKGSINFQGTQPLSGPMRQPSWDLNVNRNIYNNGRTTADVYGGLNKVPGQRVQPHFGVQAERNFGNNGFIRGHTQFQPRPGGHGLSPSVGVTGGFRFRRAAEDADEAVSAEEY
ncbi:hymenoptaecin [Lasius niger]|uniref:Hymenoptaecin n=1 Tax=Lasius niger TaxID=67767 RepID=A0A0J7KZS5_LASNI|nr:hymenoptaecin [Lasius niger]